VWQHVFRGVCVDLRVFGTGDAMQLGEMLMLSVILKINS
jgi:hypothetical protein